MDDLYVYLDFDGKIPRRVFEETLFLQCADLDTPKPLVQINNQLFKGSYEDAVGTNIFLENIPKPIQTSPIQDALNIQPFVSQTKTIRLEEVFLKSEDRPITATSTAIPKLNLDQNYQTTLSKLSTTGSLDIEDLLVKTHISDENVDLEQETRPQTVASSTKEDEEIVQIPIATKSGKTSTLDEQCNRLKLLARIPTRHETVEKEIPAECLPQDKLNYEYHNLECSIRSGTEYFQLFSSLEKISKPNTLSDLVNLDRCVLQGLITSSKRQLNSDELSCVLHFNNFENLSLYGRYLVLYKYHKQLDEIVKTASESELQKVDENGRNLQEIQCLIKRLLVSLRNRMFGYNFSKNTSADAVESEIPQDCVEFMES